MSSTTNPERPHELPDALPDALPAEAPPDRDAWRRVQPFGAGLKRKRIKFVPAGATPSTFAVPARPQSDGPSVAALYSSLVGLTSASTSSTSVSSTLASPDGATPPPSAATPDNTPATISPEICTICGLPASDPSHTLTLAHQSSLEHSVPPHHLPRSSVGLKILQHAGWDPDSRLGLGAAGEGRRFPVKAEPKEDRRGIGVKRTKGDAVAETPKPEKLNAKQVRKQEEDAKKRRGKLMRTMGGTVDVEAYLMGEAAVEGLR